MRPARRCWRFDAVSSREPTLCRFIPGLLLCGLALTVSGRSTKAQAAAGGEEFRPLPNHVPSWANARNLIAAIPAEQPMEPMTLVLARHSDKERAFEKLLEEQQDPASPEFHHWLTPSQIGERFGLAADEIAALRSWLESQGLQVDWVAPARNFIGLSGSAGDVGRAFRVRLNYYSEDGKRKVAADSAPLLPAEFLPLVRAIHGLYTIENRPMSRVLPEQSASPNLTASNGLHFLTQGDFNAIYEVTRTGLRESPIKVGIVGRSRVNLADLVNYRNTQGFAPNPIEIIPRKFGGVDPGPPRTSPPPSGVSIGDQAEATLDVERAGNFIGVLPLLVVTTAEHGDIGADAQYLVQTEPVPAPVMNISFGECESKAGKAGVDYWDTLFQQAVAEGISVFVASGDSGASGCDAAFSTPPANPEPNSPNYICSSSYATCVGGTELNDTNCSSCWNESGDASGNIPEGAWNDPLIQDSEPQVASSGGGVSKFIPTPSWQTGKGVPAARAGRYTPDVAFSAAEHDAYFGCMAAAGGNCVYVNGGFRFVGFAGTSAAAPDMAGITAILVWWSGSPQGNLNPRLYSFATSHPYMFHDVTAHSSGVGSCEIDTASMCNNSIPGPSGLTGGQPGYKVGVGYDQATGLGSLNVNLLNLWFPAILAPHAITEAARKITDTSALLAGTEITTGVKAQYWFTFGRSASLTGRDTINTPPVWFPATRRTTPVTAAMKDLIPGTKYYFRFRGSNSFGALGVGDIQSFVTKSHQTITFPQPKSPVSIGTSVILTATTSSGLPVRFSVVEGEANLHGSILMLNTAGTVVVAANQPGSQLYLPAPEVTRKIVVQ